MKLKAKKDLTHKGKQHKKGDVFDAPDLEAQDLIRQGHAEEHAPEEDETGQSTTPQR